MNRYQLAPLIVFLTTLAAAVLLLILHLPEPGVIISLLGLAGTSLLPSVSNRTNVQAALASLHPPAMAPEQIEALKASLHPPPLPPPPPSDPPEHP